MMRGPCDSDSFIGDDIDIFLGGMYTLYLRIDRVQ